MRKMILAAIFLAVTNFLVAQTIKVQGGISVSSLEWRSFLGGTGFDKTIIAHSVFLGVEYSEKKYFSLSSNIGAIRKGGREKLVFEDSTSQTKKAILDYISFNTTINLKYPVTKRILPFINIGPRIDYLIASDFIDKEEANKVSFGLITGIGLKYQLSGIQIGICGDYLLNFNNIYEYDTYPFKTIIRDKTFLINFFVTYRLR